MKEIDHPAVDRWVAKYRTRVRNWKHQRIGRSMERHEPTTSEIIKYISFAPLDRDAHERRPLVWQTWADYFFVMLTDRRASEREPTQRQILTALAARFSPRRYAYMIEMLGIYAEGTNRGAWLAEVAQPFLELHRNEKNKREEFFMRITLSQIPVSIKGGMMRSLHEEYKEIHGVSEGIIFSATARTPIAAGISSSPKPVAGETIGAF